MQKPILVMKFGGTSVGSADRIRRVAELVRDAGERYAVVVVASAMAKTTDLLLDTLAGCEAGDEAALEAALRTLEERHVEAARELAAPDRLEDAASRIRAALERYSRIARGMLLLGERPPRSVDDAVSTGERLSTILLTEALRAMGVDAERFEGSDLIVTDDVFGSASPLTVETAAKTNAALRPTLERGGAAVVTGFNGATRDGRPTTLGRGGSDFSAAILGGALDAEEVWIWTDVDGILTADPRIAPDAVVLPEVTYNEAAELAFAGAKVLHERTLQPVVEKNIPVRIKNSLRADAPGTRISAQAVDARGVRAITSMPKVTLISIEAVDASQSGAQLMSRALAAVARAKVEVLLLSRSSFRQNFCMLVRTAEAPAALESLREELALELAHGYVHPIEVDDSVGLLAAVGEGMRGTPGLAGRLFTAISERKINITAIAQGSSELTIAIVLRQEDLNEAVRVIHAECELGRQASAAVSAEL